MIITPALWLTWELLSFTIQSSCLSFILYDCIKKASRKAKLAFKRFPDQVQTLSGARTIQTNASPVMAPATNPLVTAMTVVLTAGGIRPPV